MKNKTFYAPAIFIALSFACLQTAALGQTASQDTKEIKLANIAAQGIGVRWDVTAPYMAVTLTVSGPDGRVFRKEFPKGAAPEFTVTDKQGERLTDGQYNYELRLTPVLSEATKQALKEARGKDDDAESVRAPRKRAAVAPQPLVESGTFSILNGSVIVAGAIEESGARPISKISFSKTPVQPRFSAIPPVNALAKYRLHHPFMMFDQVIPDDLIVQGSECVGLDCVNNEAFNFDTIRMKENNTRIAFNDTSSAAGFPTRDWRIRANSSDSGGASALFFDDMGNTSTGAEAVSSTPLTLTSGAPTNSVFVASNGKVGLRTGTPVLDLHITTSDTPAHRLEQTNAGGFTAQTWDIAGNEANFFVRDVTGGSRLPFRIRPGAPTSSVDISANGNVGIGTASPKTRLDLKQVEDSLVGGLHLRRTSTNDTWAMATASDNNLYMGYATNASGADANADFTIFPLVLTNNNRVGIGGTAAPDQALSVLGDASKSVGGGSWQVFSDERLKNIKGRFTSGLRAVMQLQPIRYQYKPDNALGLKAEREQIGFGAQALQKIVPEAVTRNDNGYLQVNNDPIIWTMLNAIKEQQQEIQQLREEVRQLRAATRRVRR
jgi:endosialidase-like protein